jgi:hypothetical protein
MYFSAFCPQKDPQSEPEMHDASADRRRQAELYRRLARIPTEGGHSTNRLLLVMAAHLENKAIEQVEPGMVDFSGPKKRLSTAR